VADGQRTIRLTLEYDGARFSGWQIQPELRTVQGELKRALETLCRHPVTVYGAGRTDAGVHARAQVAHFHTRSDVSTHRLTRGIAGLCRPGLVAVAAEEVDEGFHARRSATGKVYRYRVLARAIPSPLLAERAWHVPFPLDTSLLERELATLPARADWSAYRASDCGARDPVKSLRRAELCARDERLLVFEFEGCGFLKQMVRNLAGTLVDVARGRLEPGSMVRIRDGRDRTAAGPTAPAHGLCLERVLYR
jgi:tRNA pseudouridine38-40 synthase